MKRLSVKHHDKTVNMSLPGAGNFSAHITVSGDSSPEEDDDVFLSLHGLDSTNDRHVRWGRVDLKPGDVVRIAVHDDQESDPPISYTDRNTEESLDRKRKRVRRMAAELGWTLNE